MIPSRESVAITFEFDQHVVTSVIYIDTSSKMSTNLNKKAQRIRFLSIKWTEYARNID